VLSGDARQPVRADEVATIRSATTSRETGALDSQYGKRSPAEKTIRHFVLSIRQGSTIDPRLAEGASSSS
jgi:hypothetical protein